MKRFLSTLTSVAMMASFAAGSMAAPLISNAAAKPIQKTLEIRLDKTQVDVSSGDAKVKAGVYLKEDKGDTRLLYAALELGGPLVFSDYKSPTDKTQKMADTLKDGTSINCAGGGLFFIGEISARTGEFSPFPGGNGEKATVNFTAGTNKSDFMWSISSDRTDGTVYDWFGTKSDDYPLMTYEITVPAGSADGNYAVNFDIRNKGTSEVEPLCATNISNNSSKTLDPLSFGGLAVVGATIKVGNGAVNSDTTTTTPGVVPTTTTTAGSQNNNNQPVANKLNLKIADEVGAKGATVYVPITGLGNWVAANPWDSGVMGCDFVITYDATNLTFKGFDGDCAYGGGSLTPNAESVAQWGGQRMAFSNSIEGGINIGNGEELLCMIFQVSASAPDAKYVIGWGTNPSIKFTNYKQEQIPVNLIAGSITVGNTDATTTTTDIGPTATTTTTTATVPTQPTQPSTVLYGDANCDGVVNIADVVCLNKSIANPSLYALTDQGKKNADVNIDGKCDSADAQHIINYIVKLLTDWATIQ